MRSAYIFSSMFSYDMAGWFWEKSEKTLDSLARAVEYFQSMPDDLTESEAATWSELGGAIGNATKLYAVACGAVSLPPDADVIAQYGRRGLELVAYRYGAISQLEDGQRKLSEFMERVGAALQKRDRTTMTSEMLSFLPLRQIPLAP